VPCQRKCKGGILKQKKFTMTKSDKNISQEKNQKSPIL